MSKFQLHGAITALVTPFNEDLSIDFPTLDKLIEFQIESGIDGIVVCGSTGESATLTSKEKLSIIIRAVETAKGRIPIIAGTGSNDTKATMDLTYLAKEAGASGVLLVAPYYNKPTQEGMYQHYLAISEHVSIPQIIYNIPSRSMVNMTGETQVRIAKDCKNVVAVKEASANLEQMSYIMKYAPKGFILYSGDDYLTVPIISIGGKGVISTISNYAPKQFTQMTHFALKGDFESAKKIYYSLFDLMQLNFIEPNPTPAKSALALMGYVKPYFRMPILPIQPTNLKLMESALKKAKLLK